MNRRELFKLGLGTVSVSGTSLARSASIASQTEGVPRQVVNLTDLGEVARERMEEVVYQYVSGGAADELTLRWNVEAYQQIRLNPSVLVDVSAIDTTTSIFGIRTAAPILLAPTAFHRLVHPEAESATVRGAGAADVIAVVSNATTTSLTTLSGIAKTPLWFQLFARADRTWIRDLVHEVEESGVKAISLTVDNPVSAIRYHERRAPISTAGLDLPHMPPANATTGGPSFSASRIRWTDIEWLRSISRVPLLLKGILNPRDAVRAVESGVSGIIVSNHGARNLDTVPATVDALPMITQAVEGRVPILVDGGIRRGTDVLKALALGATAILIGRPYLYGLAVDGANGVEYAVSLLRKELETAMAMSGRPTIASIDRSLIWNYSRCGPER